LVFQTSCVSAILHVAEGEQYITIAKIQYITIAKIVKRGGLPPAFSDMAHNDNYTGRKRPRYTKHTNRSVAAQ
jgi:hypothetical protein